MHTNETVTVWALFYFPGFGDGFFGAHTDAVASIGWLDISEVEVIWIWGEDEILDRSGRCAHCRHIEQQGTCPGGQRHAAMQLDRESERRDVMVHMCVLDVPETMPRGERVNHVTGQIRDVLRQGS